MGPDELVINGVAADTGETAHPGLTLDDVAEAFKEGYPIEGKGPLRQEFDCGFVFNPDRTDLSKAGWGLVLASEEPREEAILNAMKPLLKLRGDQAGEYFRIFRKEEGFSAGEGWERFLWKFGQDPESCPVAEKVPLYLLVVGSPDSVSFDSQFHLDLTYNVGRVDFDPIDGFGNYARAVTRHEKELEKAPPSDPAKLVLFGARHDAPRADRATALAEEELIHPLAGALAKSLSSAEYRNRATVQTILGPSATKKELQNLLGGPAKPDVLLTATHGLFFYRGHKDQEARQGALVCSDWTGEPGQKIPEGAYFSQFDLGDDSDLSGLIAFLFACFSGGTPKQDQFIQAKYGPGRPISDRPFLGALPMRLLGGEKGALAVIGHVERVWSLSFFSQKTGHRVQPFHAFIASLLRGFPVGEAMQMFNEVWQARKDSLVHFMHAPIWQTPLSPSALPRYSFESKDMALARLWLAANDARSWILFGDPAVRIRHG